MVSRSRLHQPSSDGLEINLLYPYPARSGDESGSKGPCADRIGGAYLLGLDKPNQ